MQTDRDAFDIYLCSCKYRLGRLLKDNNLGFPDEALQFTMGEQQRVVLQQWKVGTILLSYLVAVTDSYCSTSLRVSL